MKQLITSCILMLVLTALVGCANLGSSQYSDPDVPTQPTGELLTEKSGFYNNVDYSMLDCICQDLLPTGMDILSVVGDYNTNNFYLSDNHVQVWSNDNNVILYEFDYQVGYNDFCTVTSFRNYSQHYKELSSEPNHLVSSFSGKSYFEIPGEYTYIETGTITKYALEGNKRYIEFEKNVKYNYGDRITETKSYSSDGQIINCTILTDKSNDNGTDTEEVCYDGNGVQQSRTTVRTISRTDWNSNGTRKEKIQTIIYDSNNAIVDKRVETIEYGWD